jgi:hypothetical protein
VKQAMTDAERQALNREIAEGLGWCVNGGERWVPDFAADLNAAWEMGERLQEMGLGAEYSRQVHVLLEKPPNPTLALLQADALTRARAAAALLGAVRGGRKE